MIHPSNVKIEPLYSLYSIAMSKNHFQMMYVVGKGGFGKVWKVEHKKEKKTYAMKEMSKARILTKKSVESVMKEKNFLIMLNHR